MQQPSRIGRLLFSYYLLNLDYIADLLSSDKRGARPVFSAMTTRLVSHIPPTERLIPTSKTARDQHVSAFTNIYTAKYRESRSLEAFAMSTGSYYLPTWRDCWRECTTGPILASIVMYSKRRHLIYPIKQLSGLFTFVERGLKLYLSQLGRPAPDSITQRHFVSQVQVQDLE
jgi:hypothetical protein